LNDHICILVLTILDDQLMMTKIKVRSHISLASSSFSFFLEHTQLM